jgi:hypothetical protein
MLFQSTSCITGGERRLKAKALASGGDPGAETLDGLAVAEKLSGMRTVDGAVAFVADLKREGATGRSAARLLGVLPNILPLRRAHLLGAVDFLEPSS